MGCRRFEEKIEFVVGSKKKCTENKGLFGALKKMKNRNNDIGDGTLVVLVDGVRDGVREDQIVAC